MLDKKKLTLLVCSSNKKKLKIFISENFFVLNEVFCLFVVDFDLDKGIIPLQSKVVVLKNSSLSCKRNFALQMISSEYIAMVDDDCFFNKNWLKEVLAMISKEQECVFGDVRPFLKSYSKDSRCLVYIKSKKSKEVNKSNFCDHFKQIGFTNNCLIKTKMLVSVSGLKEWLGPGTFLRSGEDAELILSILASNKSIFHNKNMVVFHDSWTSKSEVYKRRWAYQLGGITAYFFHLLQGDKFCFKYIKSEYLSIIFQISKHFSQIISNPSSLVFSGQRIISSLFLLVFTPLAAFYYYILHLSIKR